MSVTKHLGKDVYKLYGVYVYVPKLTFLTFKSCKLWCGYFNNCIYVKHLKFCNSCSIQRIRDYTASRYAAVDEISCNICFGPTYIFSPVQHYTHIRRTHLLALNTTVTDKTGPNSFQCSTDLKRNCRFRFETSMVSMSTTWMLWKPDKAWATNKQQNKQSVCHSFKHKTDL